MFPPQVKEDEASEAMQTDATPEPQPLPKRQKTNNVVGVGHVSPPSCRQIIFLVLRKTQHHANGYPDGRKDDLTYEVL